jgi:voltage-gated potassium channel
LALLVGIAAAGIVWFWLIEGWSLVDATYQTVTTVTTVGFGEVRAFDTSSKIFAIVLMIVGVSAALFTLGGVFEELLEQQLVRIGRRRMDRRIDALSGHVIICGYGRVGTDIARSLAAKGEQLVVVDLEQARCEAAAQHGHLVVVGDGTEDDTLTLAGVHRATTLIVSLGDDAEAISTVLSARVLNASLRIVARANAASTEAKLRRAGCDRVVNPLHQGAQRMAAFAQQPAVADFLDVVVHDGSLEYRLEEIVLPAGSHLVQTTFEEAHLRARTGALILALRQADGTFLSNPAADAVLAPGVTLIAIGTDEQIRALETLVAARQAPEPESTSRTETQAEPTSRGVEAPSP